MSHKKHISLTLFLLLATTLAVSYKDQAENSTLGDGDLRRRFALQDLREKNRSQAFCGEGCDQSAHRSEGQLGDRHSAEKEKARPDISLVSSQGGRFSGNQARRSDRFLFASS